MLTPKLLEALNEQVNREFFSEYLYLGMAGYCYSLDLNGFANFFMVQAQEEHQHALKIYNYIYNRNGKVILKPLDAPKMEYNNIMGVFEETLKHEQAVTAAINNLMELAIKENDHATVSFLKWFVDEQVEEELSVTKILNKFKIIGTEGSGLLFLDSELGKRTFTPSAE
ncbi:MAG: ferritin [Ignavibacteria bacterium]